MRTELLTLGQVSKRLKTPPHIIDYVYSSGKIPSPKVLSGMRLFTQEDVTALSKFLKAREKLREKTNKIRKEGVEA